MPNIYTGADPAVLIRGGPYSNFFLSDLKKLLKRGQFFVVPKKKNF